MPGHASVDPTTQQIQPPLSVWQASTPKKLVLWPTTSALFPEETTKPPVPGPSGGRNKIPKFLVERKPLMGDATRCRQKTQGGVNPPPGAEAQTSCGKQALSMLGIDPFPSSLAFWARRMATRHEQGTQVQHPQLNHEQLQLCTSTCCLSQESHHLLLLRALGAACLAGTDKGTKNDKGVHRKLEFKIGPREFSPFPAPTCPICLLPSCPSFCRDGARCLPKPSPALTSEALQS